MYQAGIYCRISIEAEKKAGEYSNSIHSQIKWQKDYIADHSDVVEVKIYADDGASGSNFEEQNFEECWQISTGYHQYGDSKASITIGKRTHRHQLLPGKIFPGKTSPGCIHFGSL